MSFDLDFPLRLYGNVRAGATCKAPEVMLAGPADTGKTVGLCGKLHILALTYNGAQLAIVRKTYKSMPGSVLQTFEAIAGGLPRVYGGKRAERYLYPNGSTVWLGGMDNPDKVLSSERDVIYVNQAEELSLPEWEVLGTRATGRAGNMPYAQMVGDCNPSAPTHWIMQRSRNGGPMRRFDTTHRDNPELFDPATGEITAEGERRLGALRNLTGSRLLRLYHGLWAAPEGAIYDVFDEEKHKVVAFEPPALWPRIVGVDPFGAYIAAVWLAVDIQAGIVNVYREYYQPFGATTPGHVDGVLHQSQGETIFAWIGGGPSERQARADWTGAGIPLLEPPFGDVWAGIDRVYQLLKEFKLVIHDSCPNLLSEIGSYSRKLKDGEPTENIEDKEKFHCLDSLRYAIAWLTEPGDETRVVYAPVRIGPDW